MHEKIKKKERKKKEERGKKEEGEEKDKIFWQIKISCALLVTRMHE